GAKLPSKRSMSAKSLAAAGFPFDTRAARERRREPPPADALVRLASGFSALPAGVLRRRLLVVVFRRLPSFSSRARSIARLCVPPSGPLAFQVSEMSDSHPSRPSLPASDGDACGASAERLGRSILPIDSYLDPASSPAEPPRLDTM